jgi:hypothetical protein
MDKHSHSPEDLNELERRLAAWQPSAEALDADAVLFAAGRASVQPGRTRFVWPALSALLTALAIVLGLWLVNERNERLALAGRLHERPTSTDEHSPSVPVGEIAPSASPGLEEPAPDSYLASRRALEKGLDAWPSRVVVRSEPNDRSVAEPPILTLGQRDALLKP